MTEEQKDAVMQAYLGVRVLLAMAWTGGLPSAAQQARAVLTDLETAFPFIGERR